jgi:hypothetical protein
MLAAGKPQDQVLSTTSVAAYKKSTGSSVTLAWEQ